MLRARRASLPCEREYLAHNTPRQIKSICPAGRLALTQQLRYSQTSQEAAYEYIIERRVIEATAQDHNCVPNYWLINYHDMGCYHVQQIIMDSNWCSTKC